MAAFRAAIGRAAAAASDAVASPWAVALVGALLLGWLAVGVATGFGEAWHAVLNAAGWLVALAMLFLLHHAQRRETLAIQAKLDELVLAVEGARDDVVRAERLTTDELEGLRRAGPPRR